MSTDLLDTPTNGGGNIVKAPTKDIIKARLPQMLVTLPKSLHERFKQAAIAVSMTPNIADCDPNSVASAIYGCARLNLIPEVGGSAVLKQAYIIPFKKKATIVLGYPGLIDLARRACPGLELFTGVVYANDDYTLLGGTKTELIIRRFHWQNDEAPGELIFSYCVFKAPEASGFTTVIVPRYKLDELAASKRRPGSSTPWDTNFPEMCEKTGIRRAARLWTLSPDRRDDAARFREALAVDESDELPPMPDQENADLADLAEGERSTGGDAGASANGDTAGRKRVNSTVK